MHISHLITRVLLAMYLAIWSPALCCCGVKAAMGTVTGVRVASCSGTPMQAVETARDAAFSCCAHRERPPVKATQGSCHAPTATSSSSEDDSSPCRCHETGESKVRIDTGARVSIPAALKLDTLPVMLPAVLAEALAPSVAEGVCVSVHRLHATPPPPTTLLAQHCLLLT